MVGLLTRQKNNWLKTNLLSLFRSFSSMATKSVVWESMTSVPSTPVSRRTCTLASVCLPILLNTGTSSLPPFAVWLDGGAFSLETSESRSREWKLCVPDSSEIKTCQYHRYSIRKELEITLIDKTRWNCISKVLAIQEMRENVIILVYRNCSTCCWMVVQVTHKLSAWRKKQNKKQNCILNDGLFNHKLTLRQR